MRRSRQGRIINWILIFIIYCSIQVYSQTTEDIFDTELSSTIPPNEELDVSLLSTEATTYAHDSAPPTYRSKRNNCTPPAIEQFPRPIMKPEWRKHGALIINVIIALFTFCGLTIVCNDYFVASLGRICEELKISPDVAGATFMAAGSSAPELATVVIGVFFAKDDIGVSGVNNSGVFNIMFVISVCALCSGTVCHLNWWPLVRDCFFYSISILVMLFVISNDYIRWYEALIMVLFYVVYCIALYFNTSLEKWAHSLQISAKLPTAPVVTNSSWNDPTANAWNDPTANAWNDPTANAWNDPTANAWNDPTANAWNDPTANAWDDTNVNSRWDQGQQNMGYNMDGDPTDQTNHTAIDELQQKPTSNKTLDKPPGDAKYNKSKEVVNPLKKPIDGGLPAVISWGIVFPIHYICRLTIPDCRTEKHRKWYAYTFSISIVWISFYAFFMVWQITIIGTTMGIPDTVMGLTFVAAGVSVPNAISSIAVIEKGYGNMAVSNAVGSNVFNILICLGLTWFIQTTVIYPGGHVNVISKGLTYSVLSPLLTVVFLLLSVHLNGWKLDRRLGIILMIWYLVFITIASMYELNIFGDFNPHECYTDY